MKILTYYHDKFLEKVTGGECFNMIPTTKTYETLELKHT